VSDQAETPWEAKTEAQTGPPPQDEQGGPLPAGRADEAAQSAAAEPFIIGPRVAAAARVAPHQRTTTEPLYRPLRIFAIDPAASRLDGAVATIDVPYEPLAPGPSGALFEVDDIDRSRGRRYARVDLDDPYLLMSDGRTPAAADPQFHQQMVYAVASRVYFAFKAALGRNLAWGFDDPSHSRLRIRPHALADQNAYYDRENGELAFGYFPADADASGNNLPGGIIFTCLSHDIVAHETTHALLDGLRAHFALPTGPDVLAFHEAFADLVAVLLHFEYPDVVRPAIRQCRGDLRKPSVLAELASQFGASTGAGKALRHAIDDLGRAEPALYDRSMENHALGGVLVAAVYEAFTTVFARKTARARRLATGGTGILPDGELPADLVDELAEAASRLAKQILKICVRAVDYCPTVDVHFGEFLRAIITADVDLVPDDPWGYREALIAAFRRRRIYPAGVPNLSEEALRWDPPGEPLPAISGLDFASLRFRGDPAMAADDNELSKQARALGTWIVSSPRIQRALGVAPADAGAAIGPPCVESIRALRRVGPDAQVVFDVVAEVTQRRRVNLPSGKGAFHFVGGATVIAGPDGVVRYVVSKRITNEMRLNEQCDYVTGQGNAYWTGSGGVLVPDASAFQRLHGGSRGSRGRAPEGPVPSSRTSAARANRHRSAP
jgi:hypothetical protein